MGFVSWLTGRDEKEADVYANFEKVDLVVSEIQKIRTGEIEEARAVVNEAIKKLNNVNGLSQYVGSIDFAAFDALFDNISTAIEDISKQIQNKANDIKEYESAAWWEKAGSSFLMGGSKLGEGILSVFEDIGDGAVSIVGWIAPKDSGLENACSNFVKKEWSHDAFNFYYESDIAKKSAFTEDSKLAGAIKISGAITGTLAITAATAGAASGVGLASKGGKAAKAANILIGNTTRANTTAAVLMGMGSGTESGLRQGMSFDDAALSGAKQGAVQGAIAYGFGKLGEKNAAKPYKEQIKQGTQLKEQAEATLEQAGKDMVNPEFTQGMIDKAKNTFSKAQDDIIRANKMISDGQKSLSNIQGYNDVISKTSYKAGQKISQKISQDGLKSTAKAGISLVGSKAASAGNKVVSGAKQVGKAIKDPGTTVKNAYKSGATAAKNAATSSKDAFKTATTTIKNKATDAISKTKTNIANTVSGDHKITKIVKGAGNTIGKVAKAPVTIPVQIAEKAVTGVKTVAKGAISSSVVPGVAAVSGNRIYNNIQSEKSSAIEKAVTQFTSKPQINQDIGDSTSIKSNITYTVPKSPTVNTEINQTQPSTSPQNVSNGVGSSKRSTPTVAKTSNNKVATSTPSPTTTSSPTSTYTNEEKSEKQFKIKDLEGKDEKNSADNRVIKDIEPIPPKKPEEEPPKEPTPQPPTDTTTPPSNNDNNINNTPPTQPAPQPSEPQQPQQPPINNSEQNTQHTGGGYSGSNGYQDYDDDFDFITDDPEDFTDLDDMLSDSSTSIDEVIKGSKYTKIPTSTKPITTSSGSGGTVIPVVAGLSAAAAAGIGAKVYMDRKNNNENGEDDEIETEEWTGEDTIDLDYDDSSDTEAYLDDDDDYGYQSEEQTEKYDARNNEELADLQ